MCESNCEYAISENEKIRGFIAWFIPLIDAILVLVPKPSYKYAKHWAYLSISFFIVIVVSQVVIYIANLVPFTQIRLGPSYLITFSIWVCASLTSTRYI